MTASDQEEFDLLDDLWGEYDLARLRYSAAALYGPRDPESERLRALIEAEVTRRALARPTHRLLPTCAAYDHCYVNGACTDCGRLG